MKKLKKILSQLMLIVCLSTFITPNVAVITNLPVVATAQAAYNKETINDVQEALNNEGYNCGTPDGVVGKNTKTAIKKYQKDNKLKITGTINNTLLKSLGVTVTKSASSSTAKTEATVYITRTGSKYHRAGCRYLRQSQIAISLSDAKRNYEPCSVCNP
ncbi:peptidoglycan-binding domain-containing protein [Anaerocolumna xylanovorans]|uniref:Peptidoglycan-binding (PGRP) domain of peptidoglycan hydrolases-containing protein n=1 Tax=Anaerocolumna xylanovorans DSM 12503 TaxID=1121345 RepID=A0A1M7YN18_9FIRM|nr:peptidoglycan-binding domain-containing protein [Anaerocolumna xylanovorans]SHO54020.1 Peptidoglycan-binding (PGRP) domain of peptidoglycan hydrolases-containing protein [Anaerocolumna xylanovorans DSM 12503]